MKIVVIGGSGLIGSKLVANLRSKGHAVVAASPDSGINTITGEGLDEALAGAQVVVDVSNSPSFEDKAVMDFFRTSTGNLLKAGKAAGVKHLVALSVVGTDRLQASGYFRAKQAQEDLIRAGSVPWTIVHSTQFFEFVPRITKDSTEGDTVRLSPAMMQPILSDDVAAALTDVTTGAPANAIVEIAGPEAMRLTELVREYLSARENPIRIVADPHALYFGAELDDRTLMPGPNARLSTNRFGEWLRMMMTPG
jgi:uncharacterized protein YbjT (DUF2867 family)